MAPLCAVTQVKTGRIDSAQELSSVKVLEEPLCDFNVVSLGFAFSNEL